MQLGRSSVVGTKSLSTRGAMLASVAACVTLASCIDPYPTVKVVLPDRFAGPFVILEDPAGVALKTDGWVTTVPIPECRVLRVRSSRAIRMQAQWMAMRENGERIPAFSEATHTQVALRGGGSQVGGAAGKVERYIFYVGTDAEYMGFDFVTFPTPTCKK